MNSNTGNCLNVVILTRFIGIGDILRISLPSKRNRYLQVDLVAGKRWNRIERLRNWTRLEI